MEKIEFIDEQGNTVTDVMCQYSAQHFRESIPATTVLDCGPAGQVPACGTCAEFMEKIAR